MRSGRTRFALLAGRTDRTCGTGRTLCTGRTNRPGFARLAGVAFQPGGTVAAVIAVPARRTGRADVTPFTSDDLLGRRRDRDLVASLDLTPQVIDRDREGVPVGLGDSEPVTDVDQLDDPETEQQPDDHHRGDRSDEPGTAHDSAATTIDPNARISVGGTA